MRACARFFCARGYALRWLPCACRIEPARTHASTRTRTHTSSHPQLTGSRPRCTGRVAPRHQPAPASPSIRPRTQTPALEDVDVIKFIIMSRRPPLHAAIVIRARAHERTEPRFTHAHTRTCTCTSQPTQPRRHVCVCAGWLAIVAATASRTGRAIRRGQGNPAVPRVCVYSVFVLVQCVVCVCVCVFTMSSFPGHRM